MTDALRDLLNELTLLVRELVGIARAERVQMEKEIARKQEQEQQP